jgi:hypothetical protein
MARSKKTPDVNSTVARTVEKNGVRVAPSPTTPKRRRRRVVRAAATDFVERIGPRDRRIFYVSPKQADTEGFWLQKPGWYVNTVDPPNEWGFNDPFGPFDSLEALRADAGGAYENEPADEEL